MANEMNPLSEKFLNTAYNSLGYKEGMLLDATDLPNVESDEDAEHWLEKGEWLALAAKIGADKVFFVENDPVIVFCELPDASPQKLLETFRQVWCMARPQCLFIATPGELKVYSLNHPPVQHLAEWETVQPLAVVQRVAEVSQKLQIYRREQFESRQIFREENFGALEQRADKRLILDLKIVRRQLLALDSKIDPRHIHALIGRSIFVRYLEDRGILTPEYFQKVAENKNHPKWSPEWLTILEKSENDLAPGYEHRRYTRVLRNKDLTYALFEQLTDHFNGDMFPHNPEEQTVITQSHLDLLRGFLLGNVASSQPKLFLWAYDFSIIPIELISSIYEEFYHKSDDTTTGTHYTPSVLVEYVLSQVLTSQCLAQKPRILDLACGSAIFLVQAFRRIVRYEESQLGRALTTMELREILRHQIVGIEINEEAIRVAAFSLYLALLHYQEPKSILAQIEQRNGERPLPHIIFNAGDLEDRAHYHVLYQGNTFNLLHAERAFLQQALEAKPRFKGRIEYERLCASQDTLPFAPQSFDIIVGNPPWGYLKRNEGSPALHEAQVHTLRWCDVFGWSVGDKELSQAFIARALRLLKPDGDCGLLVSAGVFLKRGRKSQEFRQRWLQESVLEKVVNFMHVRHVFFSEAVSPFFFVQYQPGQADITHHIQYWSAKKTESFAQAQAIVLTLPDIHQVRQSELLYNDLLWKVYWWGGHRDATLVSNLNLEDKLSQLAEEQDWPAPKRGFENQRSTAKSFPSEWLKDYKELSVSLLKRYGSVETLLENTVPDQVRAYGKPEIYQGWRLLVKQGPTQACGANGRIDARLENLSYCFQSSIYGINVEKALDWQRKILIGILWSSLTRYYLFMTASSWGSWRDKIYLHELMNLPIRLTENLRLRQRIVQTVDELRNWNPTPRDILHPEGLPPEEIREKQATLEKQLDEAIFELYELSESEQDLILDLCETGLEFFYRGEQSEAVQRVERLPQTQGTVADLPGDRSQEKGLQGYVYAFLDMWNRELETIGGEFRWRVIAAPYNTPMLAVVFTTQHKNEKHLDETSSDHIKLWHEVLSQIHQAARYPVSQRIYIDGMVRAVTDTHIFIIKKDERRLWTRSLAREDAEATLLQAMILQESTQN